MILTFLNFPGLPLSTLGGYFSDNLILGRYGLHELSSDYNLMKAYKTINSFTQIPSPAQICSYLLFLLQILVFWIIIQNRYTSSTTRIVMIVLYTISVVAHIIATFAASLSDPSDSFMIKYRNHRDS